MARMISKLMAEEQLSAAGVGGVVKQLEPGDWAGRQMSAWRRMAGVEVKHKTPSPTELGAAGIGFKKVVRNG